MKKFILLLLMCYATAAICQKSKVEHSTEYKAFSLTKDDRIFLALKDTAHKHLAVFINSLKKNGMDIKNYRFLIKSVFTDNGTHEHMWSQVYLYDKDGFKGIFIDSPFDIKNIKTGDRVIIKLNDLEDWAIEDLQKKTQMGFFSEKYLESKKKN